MENKLFSLLSLISLIFIPPTSYQIEFGRCYLMEVFLGSDMVLTNFEYKVDHDSSSCKALMVIEKNKTQP